MSESAPPAAEPGVTPSSLDAGKTYTEDYVNDLKAKLEAATAREATANAGLAAHKERQRMALKGMQAEVESFVNDAYELAPEELKHEVAPMQAFAKSLGEAENPDSAMPLARVICLSSTKFKRDRSEFSKSSEAAEQLAAANKQIDELTADRDGKASRISELEALADERQSAAEKLQAELAKIGVVSEKFDFSKATAREEGLVDGAAVGAAVGAVGAGRPDGGPAARVPLVERDGRPADDAVGHVARLPRRGAGLVHGRRCGGGASWSLKT